MSYYDSLISLFTNSKLTGANYILDSIIDERLRREGSFIYPYYMNIMLTYNCNTKCYFCSSNAGNNKKYDQNSSDITYRVLESSKDTIHPIIVALCGGEPMLYPLECKRYMNLYNKDTSYFLLTNLNYQLSPAHHEVLHLMNEHPLSLIQTSIDSLDDETTAFLRHGSNLNLIIRNINEIKNTYPNIHMKVNITVSEYNYSQIPNILQFCSENPVNCVHCNYVLPIGRAKREVSLKSLFSVLKGLQALADFAKQEKSKKFKELTVSVPLELIMIQHLFQRELNLDVIKETTTFNLNSRHYICHIDPQAKICYSGWEYSSGFSIEDEGLMSAYVKSVNSPSIKKTGVCEHCFYRTNCNSNSNYLSECLLIKFKEDMEELFKTCCHFSSREKARNTVIDIYHSNKYCSCIDLIITNTCNGRCVYCQSGGSQSDKGSSLDIDVFCKFIDGKDILLSITGGEPLMRKDKVIRVIEKVKQHHGNNVINLLTNASLIDDTVLICLKQNFGYYDVVQVSVYSYDPQRHHMISGRDDWSLVSENIKKLLAAGISVRVNLPLCKENVYDLEETYKYYKSLGVDHVCVSCLLDKGFAKGTADEEYILTYIDEAAKFCRKGYKDYNIAIPVEALRAYHNCAILLGIQNKTNTISAVETQDTVSLYLAHNGDVYYSEIMEKLGNISDYSLNTIPKKIISLYSKTCAECISFPYCRGKIKYRKDGPISFCEC